MVDHLKRLKPIFELLRGSNLRIQMDKSEFLCKEVQYLDHTIAPNGVKPNPDKISAVKDFPLSKT